MTPSRSQLIIECMATEVRRYYKETKNQTHPTRLRGYLDMRIQNCPSLLSLSIWNHTNLFQKQRLLKQYIQFINQSLLQVNLQILTSSLPRNFIPSSSKTQNDQSGSPIPEILSTHYNQRRPLLTWSYPWGLGLYPI